MGISRTLIKLTLTAAFLAAAPSIAANGQGRSIITYSDKRGHDYTTIGLINLYGKFQR